MTYDPSAHDMQRRLAEARHQRNDLMHAGVQLAQYLAKVEAERDRLETAVAQGEVYHAALLRSEEREATTRRHFADLYESFETMRKLAETYEAERDEARAERDAARELLEMRGETIRALNDALGRHRQHEAMPWTLDTIAHEAS